MVSVSKSLEYFVPFCLNPLKRKNHALLKTIKKQAVRLIWSMKLSLRTLAINDRIHLVVGNWGSCCFLGTSETLKNKTWFL